MLIGADDSERLAWDKQQGLLPVIVQDAVDGAVLMLGYMNREALRASFTRGRVVFFSRSKQRLWEKGETSGNHLVLRQIHADCDNDTLLITAVATGPVCHTGTRSCFGDEPAFAAAASAFLARLEAVIDARVTEKPQGSYTARLSAQGIGRIAQKLGEEGVELALAAAAGTETQVIAESADLLFHLLVLLRGRGISLASVTAELQARHEPPGRSRGG